MFFQSLSPSLLLSLFPGKLKIGTHWILNQRHIHVYAIHNLVVLLYGGISTCMKNHTTAPCISHQPSSTFYPIFCFLVFSQKIRRIRVGAVEIFQGDLLKFCTFVLDLFEFEPIFYLHWKIKNQEFWQQHNTINFVLYIILLIHFVSQFAIINQIRMYKNGNPLKHKYTTTIIGIVFFPLCQF